MGTTDSVGDFTGFMAAAVWINSLLVPVHAAFGLFVLPAFARRYIFEKNMHPKHLQKFMPRHKLTLPLSALAARKSDHK
jgi:hypothetical protein